MYLTPVAPVNMSYAWYLFLFFPMPLLSALDLVERINQFHLNVNGVGCPKPIIVNFIGSQQLG